MRAITCDRYGPPDVLTTAELPRPEPAPGEVLVRVHAAGLDRGVWHLMTGLPYLVRVMGYGFRRPRHRVPGLDLAGVVVAVGSEVTGFRPGEAVFGTADGSFAEFTCTTPDRLAPKPDQVSFPEAAAVPVSALAALQAVRDEARVEPGHRVLVIGASGGVGGYAVQLATLAGAEVTGVCSAGKADFVRSLGAARVIDYAREPLTAGGHRHDVILDLAGNRPLALLRQALTADGTLVLVGGEKGGRWFGGLGRPFRAMLLSPFMGQRFRWQFPATRPGDLTILAEHLATGRLRPTVDRAFPLAEAKEAMEYLLAGRVRGKVVLTTDTPGTGQPEVA